MIARLPVTPLRVILFLVLSLVVLPGVASAQSAEKVIVIGFDGADPDVAQEYMAEGRMPNLERLAGQGSFGDLATTNPAESPVAWASFATSQGPGYHGIFDFLRRVPGTYYPEIALASASTEPVMPSGMRMALIAAAFVGVLVLVVLIGRLLKASTRTAVVVAVLLALPATGATALAVLKWVPQELPKPVLNRQGLPFWDAAAQQGKRVTAIDIPVTFPALAEEGVQLTTALGTPDIRQTWGSWYLYSSQEFESEFSETAGTLRTVEMNGATGTTSIRGPKNFTVDASPEMSVDVSFTRLGDTGMRIEVQGQTIDLEVGQWSDFVRLSYQMNPLVKLMGTTRFKVLTLEPDWVVYQEPLNFDPYALPPTVNISFPRDFSKELADRYGLRETLGWSIATNPLKDEAIDYATFLEDLEFTLENRRRVMYGELERGDWDMFLGVFMFTDRMQHMMYRATDEEHPYYSPALAEKYGDRVEWSYTEMDRIIGEIMERYVDDDTMLMVISDHGFHSFRRGVNLNTWLVKNGYMALKGQGLADEDGNYQRLEDFLDPEDRFFKNVDWSRTKAYCLGLGSIFINLRGRESQGAVNPSEYDQVRDEIIEGLKALRDPADPDRTVVVDVYRREDIFAGPQLPKSPDLFVGFDSDYRISWQTSAGGIPPKIFQDNLNNWSGDHCSVAPDQTAGIFASTHGFARDTRSIMDVGPTALRALGLSVPEDYEGVALQEVTAEAR